MDLATDYLGLRLRNPLVASASPLSQTEVVSGEVHPAPPRVIDRGWA